MIDYPSDFRFAYEDSQIKECLAVFIHLPVTCEDLDFEYIPSDDHEAAAKLLTRLESAIQKLENLTELGILR